MSVRSDSCLAFPQPPRAISQVPIFPDYSMYKTSFSGNLVGDERRKNVRLHSCHSPILILSFCLLVLHFHFLFFKEKKGKKKRTCIFVAATLLWLGHSLKAAEPPSSLLNMRSGDAFQATSTTLMVSIQHPDFLYHLPQIAQRKARPCIYTRKHTANGFHDIVNIFSVRT